MDTPEELEGEALLEWHRVTEEINGKGHLDAADRAAIMLYCQTWAMMQESAAQLRKTGTVVKLPNGYPAQSPFLKVYNDAAKLCAKLLNEFGLTPKSRGDFKYNNSRPALEDDDANLPSF